MCSQGLYYPWRLSRPSCCQPWVTWSDPELTCFEGGWTGTSWGHLQAKRSCDPMAWTVPRVHPSLSPHSVSPTLDTTDFLHLCKAISLQDIWSRSRILGLTTSAVSSHLHNRWFTRSYAPSILSASTNQTPVFVDLQPSAMTKPGHWLDVLTCAAIPSAGHTVISGLLIVHPFSVQLRKKIAV